MLKIDKINKYNILVLERKCNELNRLLKDKIKSNDFSYSEIFISCWLYKNNQLDSTVNKFIFSDININALEANILLKYSSTQSINLINYLLQVVYFKTKKILDHEVNLLNSLLIVSISRRHDFNIYLIIMILDYTDSPILQSPACILKDYESSNEQYKKMIKEILKLSYK